MLPWLFSNSTSGYTLKGGLGQQNSYTRVVLLKSQVQLWGWGLESSLPKRPQVPFQGKNQIWFALKEFSYAAMNSGLLLFELPGHQME